MDAKVVIKCFTYNHEGYIRRCLEGFIMQQTDFPFIAVIHDDASTDGTTTIVREFAEKWPNIIKPIFEKENQFSKRDGSHLRIMDNECSKYNYQYIAFCEGDDYWTDPKKLKKQVEYMDQHPEVGLCYTDFNLFDEPSMKLIESLFKNKLRTPITSFEDHLFMMGYIAPLTWMYRLSEKNRVQAKTLCYSPVDESFVVALDFFANSKVAYLPFTSGTYTSHLGSVSRPTSLKNTFVYKKEIFDIQRIYAEHYLPHKENILIIKMNEIDELYPIAYKLGDIHYMLECEQFLKENHSNALYYIKQNIQQAEALKRIRGNVFFAMASQCYRMFTKRAL